LNKIIFGHTLLIFRSNFKLREPSSYENQNVHGKKSHHNITFLD